MLKDEAFIARFSRKIVKYIMKTIKNLPFMIMKYAYRFISKIITKALESVWKEINKIITKIRKSQERSVKLGKTGHNLFRFKQHQ